MPLHFPLISTGSGKGYAVLHILKLWFEGDTEGIVEVAYK